MIRWSEDGKNNGVMVNHMDDNYDFANGEFKENQKTFKPVGFVSPFNLIRVVKVESRPIVLSDDDKCMSFEEIQSILSGNSSSKLKQCVESKFTVQWINLQDVFSIIEIETPKIVTVDGKGLKLEFVLRTNMEYYWITRDQFEKIINSADMKYDF